MNEFGRRKQQQQWKQGLSVGELGQKRYTATRSGRALVTKLSQVFWRLWEAPGGFQTRDIIKAIYIITKAQLRQGAQLGGYYDSLSEK